MIVILIEIVLIMHLLTFFANISFINSRGRE